MKTVLVDTGIWYAMFDSRDEKYSQGQAIAERLTMLTIVVPWPTTYETLRTKFVRKSSALRQFELFLKKPNIEFVDDVSLREAAFELSLESSLRRNRPLSMIDCLIRLMIDDTNTKINYLATFNTRDFIDVCTSRRVEIICI